MKTYLTGSHGVEEALKKGRGTFYFSRKNNRTSKLVQLAQSHHVPVRSVDEAELLRRCPNVEQRGFILEITEKTRLATGLDALISGLGDHALIFLLDGITDPRNLGALLRAADQFSVDALIVPRRRSVGINADSISRSSAGAVEWVPLITVANITRTLGLLKAQGFWTWATDLKGPPMTELTLSGRNAIVMGSEGAGVHPLVKKTCDGTLRIPTRGHLDSLNVATAAGILMYEVRRQQGFPT